MNYKQQGQLTSSKQSFFGELPTSTAYMLPTRCYAWCVCMLWKGWSAFKHRTQHYDRKLKSTAYSGQSTTEYAILVGVLVVIAMVAIVAFKGKVQELWDAIAQGINAL